MNDSQGLNINISTLYDMSVISMIREHLSLPKQRLNIQPFFVVVETELNTGFRQFTYELGKRPNQRALETSLSNNDAFVMTHMALGIYKEIPPATPQNLAYGGNATPAYFPDSGIFGLAASATNVSEAAALEAIYKGFFKARADQDETFLRLDAYKFRTVPESQTVGTFKGSYYNESQFIPMYTPVIFDGNKENVFDYFVAPNADTGQIGGDTAAGQQNVMQVLHFGYVIRDYSESATIQQLKLRGVFN